MAQPATGTYPGHGEAGVQKQLGQQQATREKSGQPGQPGAMSPGHPAMDQSQLQIKPDCGEGSYRGSGKLIGKVAVVTGGDSGIGRAVCIAYCREGADVLCNYRSHDKDAADCKRACEMPQPAPASGSAGPSFPTGNLVLRKADVASREACHNLVQEAINRFGRCDIVVHNAGIQYPEDPCSRDIGDHLPDIMAVNVYPLAWLAEAALPHMKAKGGGSIIANSSINAYKGNKSLLSYSASKGALTALVRSYALALAEDNIRANSVAPGPIWTPFISATFDEEAISKFGQGTPMKRAGQPAEVAPAFVFLASNDSSFMTGHALHVDGGQWSSS